MTPPVRGRAQAPGAPSTEGVDPPGNRWRASVLTLFPEMFPGPLGLSLAGRALHDGRWSLDAQDIRAFATDRHRSVDDTPAGGGAGMVMRPDVLDAAIASTMPEGDARPLIYLTPRGRLLDQATVRSLAEGPGCVLLCGRFEGIDQRVIDARGMLELSIGDYVLSGGETAALVLLDACVRLLSGVMGAADSAAEESHGTDGLLEYPHYTRPAEWNGRAIPPVLLSGHHAEIARWRRAESERITKERRPDLWARHETKQRGAGGMDGHPAAA
jgi:tRNA (guanine37-N1)-methyltransferase